MTFWLVDEQGMDTKETDNNGNTAVHYAACVGQLGIVEWLVENTGADLQERNAQGMNVMDWARKNEHEDVLDWLEEQVGNEDGGETQSGGDEDDDENDDEDDDLTALVRGKKNAEAEFRLASERAINIPPGKSWSITVPAPVLKLGSTLSWNFSAEPEGTDIGFRIEVAGEENDPELDYYEHVSEGAIASPMNRNVVLHWDNTHSWMTSKNIGYLIEIGPPADVGDILYHAIVNEKLTQIEALFNPDKDGPAPHYEGKGATYRNEAGHDALLIAAAQGKFEVVKFLLDHEKMDLTSAGEDGANVLHWAIISGSEDMARWLVEEAGMSVSSTDTWGNSAAHYAACCGQLGLLRWLAEEKRLDLQQESRQAYTVLDWAIMKKHQHIVDWLQQKLGIVVDEALLRRTAEKQKAAATAAAEGGVSGFMSQQLVASNPKVML